MPVSTRDRLTLVVVDLQRRIQGYLYGIESESSFKECTVPRSPSPQPQRPQRVHYPQPARRDPDAPLNHLNHYQRYHGHGAMHGAVPRGEGVALIDEIRRPQQPSGEAARHSQWSQGQSLSSHHEFPQTSRRSQSQHRSQIRESQRSRSSHAGTPQVV